MRIYEADEAATPPLPGEEGTLNGFTVASDVYQIDKI